jgi:hypothetical protein
LTRPDIAENYSLPLTRVVYLANLGYFGSAMQGTRSSLWYEPEVVKLGIERGKERDHKGPAAVVEGEPAPTRLEPLVIDVDVEPEIIPRPKGVEASVQPKGVEASVQPKGVEASVQPKGVEASVQPKGVEDELVRGLWQEALETRGDVVELLTPHTGGDVARAKLAFASWSRRRAMDAVDDLVSFRPSLTERSLVGDVASIESSAILAFGMKRDEASRAVKSWLDSPSGTTTRRLAEKALVQKEIDQREVEKYEKYANGEGLREQEQAERGMRRLWKDMDRESEKANQDALKNNDLGKKVEADRQALRAQRRADRAAKRSGGGDGGSGGGVASFGWLLGTLKEAWGHKDDKP